MGTQPSRVVYAHPGSFQQGNQIQAPQGSGFARYVAHAHAPVQYAQPAPTASLPSSRFSSVPVASQAHAPVQYVQPAPAVAQPSSLSSSVPVASQAHAPVQYAQPLPVTAQAPVKQTSTAQYIPPNFVPVAPASSTPAPASSYVSPSSAAPQAAHTASATYSVPTVIAQPPGAMQLSRAAQVAPHVTGQ